MRAECNLCPNLDWSCPSILESFSVTDSNSHAQWNWCLKIHGCPAQLLLAVQLFRPTFRAAIAYHNHVYFLHPNMALNSLQFSSVGPVTKSKRVTANRIRLYSTAITNDPRRNGPFNGAPDSNVSILSLAWCVQYAKCQQDNTEISRATLHCVSGLLGLFQFIYVRVYTTNVAYAVLKEKFKSFHRLALTFSRTINYLSCCYFLAQ